MDSAVKKRQGTFAQRFLRLFFTFLLFLLFFWLLGMLIHDVGNVAYPNYTEIEQRHVDPVIQKQLDENIKSQREASMSRGVIEQRQRSLKDSTASAEQSLNQLKNREGTATDSEATREALAQSLAIFLRNQEQYQQASAELVALEDRINGLQSEETTLNENASVAREAASKEFQEKLDHARFAEATAKLAILIPLLALSLWLFYRWKNSIYLPIVIAFAAAVGLKTLLIMHDYFPAKLFLYLLLLSALAAVIRAMIWTLTSISKPNLEVLLNQYREAYINFVCPICAFPVRRGPLKFQYWTRRTVSNIRASVASEPMTDTPYCCPSCHTQLFEKCSKCDGVRHSLLPACEHCGNLQSVVLEEAARETIKEPLS